MNAFRIIKAIFYLKQLNALKYIYNYIIFLKKIVHIIFSFVLTELLINVLSFQA